MSKYYSTREMLVNARPPEETRTYKPISHAELIDLTLQSIYGAGLQVEKEIYMTAKDANVAVGRYFIKGLEDSEMQLQVSWQNSYDKSKRLTFSVGANILVCTNGMMALRGINSFKKKHTGEIQEFTPNNIPEYIKRAGEMFATLQADRESMKQVEVDKRRTAEILGRLYFEEQLIESTQLNIIKRELEKPTHDYSSKGSLWELYQFTTFAIGGIHPATWMEEHLEAHRFFVSLTGEPYEREVEDLPFVEAEDPRQLKLFNV